MGTWNRNILPVAELICIKFNLPVAMFADTNNQVWLNDWRLLDGWRVVTRINITNGTTITIKINENVAWSFTFVWAKNAASFQFIHDTCSAGVAESQTTLQQRHARLLFAADDFDALLN